MRVLLPGIAIGLLLVLRAGCEAPGLEARWSDPQPLIGKPLVLDLSVVLAPGDSLVWPEPDPRQLRPLELLQVEEPQREALPDGSWRWSRRLHLVAFALGEVVVPAPRPLLAGRPLAADSLRLQVRGRLTEGETEARPLVGPKPWPLDWRLPALALLLLALLAALVWRFRPRRPARPDHAPAPAAPDPWARFRTALAEAEDRAIWRHGDVDGHYAALSLALRGWLEDTLGQPCREWTTAELREGLPGERLTAEERRLLFELLEENDRVKYARLRPTEAEILAASIRVRTWAEAHRARRMAGGEERS
jgi:hypothetical protein